MFETYPFAIAGLIRRARNAKSPKERHDTAFYAWEASLRLAVAVRPPSDAGPLAMASLGQWVGALETADELLGDGRLVGAYSMFCKIGQGDAKAPKAITARKLLDAMPAYRNVVLGHGSIRTNQFYDDAASTLLEALDAAWDAHLFFPADAKLVWIESIEVSPDGGRVARMFDLMGLASTVTTRAAKQDDVLPRRLYLERGADLRALHPWLLYQEAELRERLLFFNGRARSSKYLDYLSGESLKGKALGKEFPGIEAEVDALFSEPRRADSVDDEAATADLFGDYRILGELGQGGMGIVYLGRQESLDRLVALKMLPPSAAQDDTAVARFKREIRALARCDHPNVVKILASGEAQNQLYYAMELIQGADLSQVAKVLSSSDDFDSAVTTASETVRTAKDKVFASVPAIAQPGVPAELSAKNRDKTLAALFRDAARGLQHLHDQGIVHRDIKPGNLMVTESDHRVVIMDLGLAAVGDASRSITRDKSSLLGTLRYIPPEQLQRSLLQVDARADIYSLGVSLYELLTDRPFLDGDTEVRLIEQVLRVTPPAAHKVKPSIARDLSVIVAKATEKDPALRYVNAEAFAQDLDNFVEGRPVVARPPTLGYLLQVAIRRHRALAAVILAAIVVGVVGTAVFIYELNDALGIAREQREEAHAQREVADTQRAKAQEQFRRAEESRYAADMRLTQASAEEGNYGTVRDGLARYVPKQGEPDLRGFEWRYLSKLLAGESVATFTGHTGEIRNVAFSPDGALLATASTDATVRVHDLGERREVKLLEIDGPGVMDIEFSPDGKTLAVASGNWRTSSVAGHVFLYDVPSFELRRKLSGHTASVNTVSFSDDGTKLASGSEDNTALVYDLSAGADTPPRVLPGRTTGMNAVAFAANSTRLVTASGDGFVQIWDMTKASEKPLVDEILHISGVMSLAVSRVGNLIAAGSRDGPVLLYDLTTNTVQAQFSTDQGVVNALAFSRDGKTLATAGSNCTIKLWDAATRRPVALLRGHWDMVFAVEFSPDDRTLASGSTDAAVKLWSTEGARRGGAVFNGAVAGIAFSPDGSTIAIAEGARPTVDAAAVRKGTAVLWDVASGERRATLTGHSSYLMAIAYSPDGAQLATTSTDGTAILWKVATGQPTATLTGHEGFVTSVAFSPDGATVATASRDHHIRLWDPATGTLRKTLGEHVGWVRSIAFSPDGALLASVGSDRTLRVWNTRTWAVIAALAGYEGAINSVVFNPAGTLIATGANDRTVRLWNIEGGVEALEAGDEIVLQGRNAAVQSVAFAPDGRTLVATSLDSSVSFWNVVTLLEVGVLRADDGGVLTAVFSPDGDTLATGSNDRTMALFHAVPVGDDDPFRPRPQGWSSP